MLPPPRLEALLLVVYNELDEADSFVLWDDFESGTAEETTTRNAPVKEAEGEEPANLSMGSVPIPGGPSQPGISRSSLSI